MTELSWSLLYPKEFENDVTRWKARIDWVAFAASLWVIQQASDHSLWWKKSNLMGISNKKAAVAHQQNGELALSPATFCLSSHCPPFFQTTLPRWAVSPSQWKSWMWTTMRQSLRGSTKLLFVKMPKQDRWEMLGIPGAVRGQGCEKAHQTGWAQKTGLA